MHNFNKKYRVRRSVNPTNRVKPGVRQVLFPYKDYSYNNYIYDNEIINNSRDYELQLAINESIKEQEEYRIKQLEIMGKTRLRIESFKDILFKIKKISMIDAKILKFYNIIEPIIESYCACNIDIYACDKALYHEIFSTLKTIRLTESEFGLFKNLFIM